LIVNSTTTTGAEDRGGTGTEAEGAIDTTRTAATRVTEAAEIDAEAEDEAEDEAIDEVDEEEDREMMERCRFVISVTSTCETTRRRRRRNSGTKSIKRKTPRRFTSDTFGTIVTMRASARGTILECLWRR